MAEVRAAEARPGLRRSAELTNTGEDPFLGDGLQLLRVCVTDPGVQRGLGAGGCAARHPGGGIQVVNLSRGVEEDASFATLAARQALEAVTHFRAVLAAELVASLRCLRLQEARPRALRAALDYLDERDGGFSEMSDRDLTSELLLAEDLIVAVPDHVAAVQRAGEQHHLTSHLTRQAIVWWWWTGLCAALLAPLRSRSISSDCGSAQARRSMSATRYASSSDCTRLSRGSQADS